MAAALSGVPDGVPARPGVVRGARTAARRRLRVRSLAPDRAQILPVVVAFRACPCGGWLAAISAADVRPRTVHGVDVEEITYAVRYELDVLMSETGRELALDLVDAPAL